MGVKERARRMGFLSVGRHGEEARIDVEKVSGRQRGSGAVEGNGNGGRVLSIVPHWKGKDNTSE
jgi:hypothetical protein